MGPSPGRGETVAEHRARAQLKSATAEAVAAQAEAERQKVVAAQAHRLALARARSAKNARDKALMTERARVEKARLELAHARSKLADRRRLRALGSASI